MDNNTATSAVSAEVKTKSRVAKILEGIKAAWLALKSSDKAWEQNGKKFGKLCSELRKLYKKPGSRKGLGFEATVKKLGVNYQKARYWADVVDGKVKAQNYAGKPPVKTTAESPTERKEPKSPKPFALVGLAESQQAEIAKAVGDPEEFSRFIYNVATNPDESPVRFLVNRCLDKLPLSDQVNFLTEIGKWIKQELATVRGDIKEGRTSRTSRAVAFLPDDHDLSTILDKVRKLAQPEPCAEEEIVDDQVPGFVTRKMAAGAGA